MTRQCVSSVYHGTTWADREATLGSQYYVRTILTRTVMMVVFLVHVFSVSWKFYD